MGTLTEAEGRIMKHLGAAFVLFRDLDAEHPADVQEFAQSIHRAQNIVLARPTMRAIKAEGQK